VAAPSEPPSLDDELDSGCGGTHADLAHFNAKIHTRADTCLAARVNRDAAKAQAEVESAVPSAGCVYRAARQNCLIGVRQIVRDACMSSTDDLKALAARVARCTRSRGDDRL
jgi:hypothetical protein